MYIHSIYLLVLSAAVAAVSWAGLAGPGVADHESELSQQILGF